MEKYSIVISTDFSKTLGGRWERLGDFSGEEFYNSLLKPKFEKAKENDEKLHIYLDGTKAYPNSFLDQSFGLLSREIGLTEVKNRIVFHTETFNWIVKYIEEEIWQKKQ